MTRKKKMTKKWESKNKEKRGKNRKKKKDPDKKRNGKKGVIGGKMKEDLKRMKDMEGIKA